MAVTIIGTLEPKNNGNFAIAEAKNIWMEDGTTVQKEIESLKAVAGGGEGGAPDFVAEFEEALDPDTTE